MHPILTLTTAGPAYIGNEANVNASIQAAIVNGIYNSPSADVYACNANATCSWHDTATLGICSACRNVTAATKQSCPQVGTPLFYQQSGGAIICNYTTPSDFMLQTNFFDTSAQQRYITRVNTFSATRLLRARNSLFGSITIYSTLLRYGMALSKHVISSMKLIQTFLPRSMQLLQSRRQILGLYPTF